MSKITTLIKIGGSITETNNSLILRELCSKLEKLYSITQNFAIIPGGGIFAEQVRVSQKKIGFSDEHAHWMAIYGMEQNGLLLSHFFSKYQILSIRDLFDANCVLDSTSVPILSIQQFMKERSGLEHSWNATSDAITAETAYFLGLKRILFVKDIDGLILDEKLIESCNINDLLALSESPLDSLTPRLLMKFKPETYIVNGFYPDRITNLLTNKKAIHTRIVYV